MELHGQLSSAYRWTPSTSAVTSCGQYFRRFPFTRSPTFSQANSGEFRGKAYPPAAAAADVAFAFATWTAAATRLAAFVVVANELAFCKLDGY